MTGVASIARVLGGHRSADGYLCCCPLRSHGQGRGARRASLLVKDGTDAVRFNPAAEHRHRPDHLCRPAGSQWPQGRAGKAA